MRQVIFYLVIKRNKLLPPDADKAKQQPQQDGWKNNDDKIGGIFKNMKPGAIETVKPVEQVSIEYKHESE